MKANVSCSNCGAEISNFNLNWGRKYWLYMLPVLVLAFLPMLFFNRHLFLGAPDFKKDIQVNLSSTSFGEDGVIFVGYLENTGEHTWSGIEIEAEFFGPDGTFVDEANERLNIRLAPGEKENFKVILYHTSRTDLSDLKHEVSINDAMRDLF